MSSILYVALGGAIGASARHILSQASLRVFGPGFPYGTMAANIIGSLLMGLLIGFLAAKVSNAGNAMRLFLGVGILGGFTTFSAFSLDAFLLLEKKAYGPFIAYVGGSVIISLAALGLGLWVSRGIFAT
ncbi:fluoride efflux transporter CrcB [Litorimonas sp. RW-G-Af-16]|uniref:fluoride efflux transporter CrcB n=1 Tax=Litorimonas sp. RW-G-Af-16 TaxID=3241168 RepID=UPI00390C7FD2